MSPTPGTVPARTRVTASHSWTEIRRRSPRASHSWTYSEPRPVEETDAARAAA